MNCLECKDLDRAFQSRLAKYIEARTAAFYRVSTELAAKKNVDMERAKTDLQEHQSACRFTAKVRTDAVQLFSERLASLKGEMSDLQVANARYWSRQGHTVLDKSASALRLERLLQIKQELADLMKRCA